MNKTFFILLSGMAYQHQAQATDYSLCRNIVREGGFVLQDNGYLQPNSPFTFTYESKENQDIYTYKINLKDSLHKIIVEKNDLKEITQINTYTEDGLTHLGSSKVITVDGKCVPVQILSYKDKEIFTDFNLCRELDAVLKKLTPKQKGVVEDLSKIDNLLAAVIAKYGQVPNPYSNVPLYFLAVGEFPTVYGGMYLERCRDVTDAGSYSRSERTKLEQTYALLEKASKVLKPSAVATN